MAAESPTRQLPSPSGWMARFAHLAAADSAVLDVAAGSGRHCRLFLSRGCRVTAIDKDVTRLADLDESTNIEVLQADLEGGPWPVPGRLFDLVVVANYLHRPLFPHLQKSLAPGGALIYETFAIGNERYGRPRNPNFLLQPGELLEVFGATLQVVAYQHGYQAGPPEAVRQGIVAVADSHAIALDPQ